MKEEDIRPDRFRHELSKLIGEDVKKLITRKDEFVEVPCPACGSGNYRKAFKKYSFTFVTCTDCQTLFINPRATPEMLSSYYATAKSYKYWNEHIFPAAENSRRQLIFRPRVERVAEICKRHNVKTNTLVDVGAGFGTFCEEVKNIGIFDRVIAVEPEPELAATCRRKGLEVIEKPIEQVSFGNDVVDVVTNFEVIEHLYSPKDFVLKCVSILPEGGLLILTTPNIEGFDLLVLGELSTNVGYEHINYFNLGSLGRLLSDCGLEVIEMLTPGQLDAELVRKQVLSGAFDISNHPFLNQILIDRWESVGDSFQRFLSDNLLSSNMWFVAKKV